MESELIESVKNEIWAGPEIYPRGPMATIIAARVAIDSTVGGEISDVVMGAVGGVVSDAVAIGVAVGVEDTVGIAIMDSEEELNGQ